ncbi:hypothetical protein EDB86DRAFT_3103122 [Lactarius hatsudake]|nr:hypothetical protein EDB86DRAFT_3103122 [Lactarius hatsudake]
MLSSQRTRVAGEARVEDHTVHIRNCYVTLLARADAAAMSDIGGSVEYQVRVAELRVAGYISGSHIAIAMALCDPTIFDFDQLFVLNAVLIAQMHPLFVLWTLLSGRLDTLHAWQKHTPTPPGRYMTAT